MHERTPRRDLVERLLSGLERNFFPLLLIAAAVVALKLPISESLWVDEAVTAWETSGSLALTLRRTYELERQSPLYSSLLWFFRALLGSSEAALRAPSLLAFIGSLIGIFTVARRKGGAELGIVAALSFLTIDSVLVAATSARTYSFALASAIWSVSSLQTWLERRRTLDAAAYLATTALSIYFHYFFGLIIAVHLLQATLGRGDAALPSAKEFSAFALSLSVLLLPGGFHVLQVIGREVSYSFVPRPSLSQLLAALFPPGVTIALVTGVGVALILRKSRWSLPQGLSMRWAVFVAIWWAAPPAIFFIASWIGESSVFLDRWFLFYAPAFALAASLVFAGIVDRRTRIFAAIIFTFVLCVREADRKWLVEDWRGLSNAIQALGNSDTPVLVYSGLVESENTAWLRDPAHRDHLLAPFVYYSLPNPLVPLPSAPDTESKRSYFAEVSAGLASKQQVILASARKKKAGTWTSDSWKSAIEALGYNSAPLPVGRSRSKTVEGAFFKRETPASSPSGNGG